MILIIMHHFALHGIGVVNNPILDGETNFLRSINFVFYEFSISYGKLGVDVFILISAYFLYNSNFKLKKVYKIIAQVFTYSTIIFIIAFCINPAIFSKNNLLNAILPIITGEYWFVSGYVILYIFSPLLNKLIKLLSKNLHIIIILILMVVFFFLNNQIMFFFVLYLIASYIRKYDINLFNKKWFAITLFFASFILLPLTKILFNIDLSFVDSPLVVICAVSMFYMFKNIKKLGHNKFINTIASTTFGIYLLHDNPYVRKWLWNVIINSKSVYQSSYFIFFLILIVLIVFCSCSIIDYIKKQTIDKFTNRLINKITK